MSLSDIKNKLYRKETSGNIAERGKTQFDIRNEKPSPKREEYFPVDDWESKKSGISLEQKKIIKMGAIAVGSIFLVVAALVAAVKIKQSSFSEERVAVSISGTQEAKSGKLLTYEINYRNDNRVALENAVLRISYPESFKLEENSSFSREGATNGVLNVGRIDAHSDGKFILRGKVYSPKGTLMYLKGELSYKPSNFNSQFSAKNQLGVNVISTPINLSVMAPQNMASGDALDYLVTYKNTGEEDFEQVRIKVDYPEGFSFSGANPKSSEGNNIWYLGDLEAGQEGKIVISGKMEGERDEVKNVRVNIGTINQGQFVSFNEESAATEIAASPLFIAQTVNGLASLSANAGDELRFEIGFRNNGDIGLRNVIVTEKLDSPVLDYTTLDMEGGAYDANNKTITWKASDYPVLKNLEPGQGGVIRFRIKVKSVIPLVSANDKNFVISSIAKIDSPDIPTPLQMNKIIAGNKMDIKLNSKLVLDVKGYYNDANIKNFGPIPPIVGQETTYTLHWIAANVSNDVADAKVEAVLPTGVVFTGKIYPEDANLTYNERNNTLTWNIGNMNAGAGISTLPKEVSFQVKIKPSPNQAGSTVELVGPSVFSAKDLFTGENLSVTAEKKTTFLREDSGIETTGYKVAN